MSSSDAGGHEPAHDPAMLELFRAELDTHLPTLSDGLLSLEKGPVDDSHIESMMRAAHSIKGAARIVGVDLAVRVAHAMEDCFTGAKNKQVSLTSEAVDTLLSAVDALQQICDPAQAASINADTLQPLLDRIALVKDGKTQSKPAAAPLAVTASPAEPQAPLKLRLELPSALDDTAAHNLRPNLLHALATSPALIEIDFHHVQKISVLGMTLLVRFVREAAQLQPAPDILFQHASPDLQLLWQSIGFHDLLHHPGKAGAHA